MGVHSNIFIVILTKMLCSLEKTKNAIKNSFVQLP